MRDEEEIQLEITAVVCFVVAAASLCWFLWALLAKGSWSIWVNDDSVVQSLQQCGEGRAAYERTAARPGEIWTNALMASSAEWVGN